LTIKEADGEQNRNRVVWPPSTHWDKRDLNPGLADLNGKTVAKAWDRVFRGEEIFRAACSAEEKDPRVRFVEHDTFGDTHGVNQKQVLADMPALLRQHEVDAVISGVGAEVARPPCCGRVQRQSAPAFLRYRSCRPAS
jgi:hypothetical protein